MNTRVFTVLSREWCHLCHDLIASLAPLAAELGWTIQTLDVDQDPVLEAKWDEWVPVVLHGETVLCHYHLDEAAIRTYCSAHPGK